MDTLKKILFINPTNRDHFFVNRVHMGMTLMASVLKNAGHSVRIYDYAFLKSHKDKIHVPAIEEIIRDYNPDVVGISVFSYVYAAVEETIAAVSKLTSAPIILGGPHFAIFPEDFGNDPRISYILIGEAEEEIRGLVERARKLNKPEVIRCARVRPENIVEADLSDVYGVECLCEYQIQLSRGCPYSCTFCNIDQMAGKIVRKRELDICVRQIKKVIEEYPKITSVAITDDCPNADKFRFKLFLRKYIDAGIRAVIWIDNVRANLVDDEMLALYKKANGWNICIGVESGDSEVFNMINKGESLGEIVEAAALIKRHGLMLGLCFVIGLPEDTLRKHQNSVQMAKKLKPDYVFWNMCIPWPGTTIYKWFQENGEIGDIRNFSTLIDPRVNFMEPVASSRVFPKEQRIQAWLAANMEPHRYFQNYHDVLKLMSLAIKYKIYKSFLVYFVKSFLPSIWEYLRYLPAGVVSRLRRLIGVVRRRDVTVAFL